MMFFKNVIDKIKIIYVNVFKIPEKTNALNNKKSWHNIKYPHNFYCSVCVNTLHEKPTHVLSCYYVKFKCNHYLHYKCLYEYLSNTTNPVCPLCRNNIIIQEKEHNDYLLFKLYSKYIVDGLHNQ